MDTLIEKEAGLAMLLNRLMSANSAAATAKEQEPDKDEEDNNLEYDENELEDGSSASSSSDSKPRLTMPSVTLRTEIFIFRVGPGNPVIVTDSSILQVTNIMFVSSVVWFDALGHPDFRPPWDALGKQIVLHHGPPCGNLHEARRPLSEFGRMPCSNHCGGEMKKADARKTLPLSTRRLTL